MRAEPARRVWSPPARPAARLARSSRAVTRLRPRSPQPHRETDPCGRVRERGAAPERSSEKIAETVRAEVQKLHGLADLAQTVLDRFPKPTATGAGRKPPHDDGGVPA